GSKNTTVTGVEMSMKILDNGEAGDNVGLPLRGEWHMDRQCTQPKQPRNAAWYKEKAMLAKAQEAGQILDEEQLAFIADLGVPDGQAVYIIIPNNALHFETYLNDMENQSLHAMQDFEQTPTVDVSDKEIHDDSNIIPYSQYLEETQQENVQDTHLQAQQDSMILSVIEQMSKQMINHETLILEEKSRSKMSEKAKEPEIIHKNISHKPIDYEKLNRLYEDFEKRFTPQQEMDAEQPFWLRISNPTSKPSGASPVTIEAPKKLPKVSLVNKSLKKLIFHLAESDNVVKIRTTSYRRDLLNEIMEAHTVFNQMDAAVQQFSVDKQRLKITKKELLLENDRLLQQIMSQEVLLTVMNSMYLIGDTVNMDGKRNESYDKCVNLEVELFKSQNVFNDLLKRHSKLEKHCISLECSIQLN
nr:hypothetical protein [Tanacetum cinerariifolium]